MVTRSSHSINMCPPHSPTRITKKSILKLPGAFHRPKTSRIRFWAFSYSMGEPCGRSNQLITYFMAILPKEVKAARRQTMIDSTTTFGSQTGKSWHSDDELDCFSEARRITQRRP